MGSRIYTRGGDGGQTSLLDGRRVDKDSIRVKAYGAVDEACSWVGAAASFSTDPQLKDVLTFLGHRLYNCASCLAAPPDADCMVAPPSDADTEFLERAIDSFEKRCGSIEFFILPGGCESSALLHVARTVCRRAERQTVSLAREQPVEAGIIRFLNRGSDLLFAAARLANQVQGEGDVPWNPGLEPPDL